MQNLYVTFGAHPRTSVDQNSFQIVNSVVTLAAFARVLMVMEPRAMSHIVLKSSNYYRLV